MAPATQARGGTAVATQAPDASSQPLVEAPRMATTAFPSWDAFFAYFSVYQSQTYQVYASKSSTSVVTRNQRIRESAAAARTNASGSASSAGGDHGAVAAGKAAMNASVSRLAGANGRTLQLVPLEVGVYAKTLICTHGGKPRSRSQGIRPRQRFRPMQCPAKLNLVAQKKLGHDASLPSSWQVVVTHHVAQHNHPLDAETYMAYPQNRRVQDPQVLETVNALREAGIKQRQIRAYLAEKVPSKHVTKSDVHNLLTRMKDDPGYTAALRAASQAATSGEIGAAPIPGGQAIAATLQPPVQQNTVLTQSSDAVGPANALPPQAQAQLSAVATRSRELQTEQATLLRQGGRDAGRPPQQMLTTMSGGNNSDSSLQTLSASGEVASGSFKLRVSRLEAQNLQLYAQNTNLREQNAQYLATMQAARTEAREAEARLSALQTSESTLAEAVSSLSQEVAALKAENTRWKQRVEQLTGQPASFNGGGFETVADGVEPLTRPASELGEGLQLGKRGSDGDSELAPQQKRTAAELMGNSGAVEGGQRLESASGYMFVP